MKLTIGEKQTEVFLIRISICIYVEENKKKQSQQKHM